MYDYIMVRIGGGVDEKVGAAKASRIYRVGFYANALTKKLKIIRAATDKLVGCGYYVTGYEELCSLISRQLRMDRTV